MTTSLDPAAPAGDSVAGTAAPARTPVAGASGFDPWAAELARLDEAAELISLDPDILAMLRRPKRVLEVAVPVRRDDGRVEVYVGWRVHHDTARGPAKGGLRFHPNLTP